MTVRQSGTLLSALLLVGAMACESPEELEARGSGTGKVRQRLGNEPDFVVTLVSGPSSATPGSSIEATVEVCNRGAVGGGTDVNLYFSDDAVISPEDFWAANLFVGYLSPGLCERQEVEFNASVPTDGAWYLGAYADPFNSLIESDETNNARAGEVMGIGYAADFVITSVKGPASVQVGQEIWVQVTVCNRGTVPDTTDVSVYLSADEIIQPEGPPGPPPEDHHLSWDYAGYLYPRECRTVSLGGYAYPPYYPGGEGPYFVGAIADPHNSWPELIETNNTLAGYRIGVGSKPDFVVTSVKGPDSAQIGQSITAQVTVCNRGTQGDSTEVGVYLSTDATIEPNVPPGPPVDFLLGSAFISYLEAGLCTTVPVSGSAYLPSPGTEGPYFIGAVADPYASRIELMEDNNALAGYRIGMGTKADFVITSVTGPASALSGQSMTAKVTVCNRGTQGDSTDVGVYLSADATIRANVPPAPPEDSFVGSAPVGYLYPNQCKTVTVQGNAYLPPPGTDGPYFVGAVADPYASRPELIDDNNALAGYRMGVGGRPDFVITSVTGPASALYGQYITTQVTVCNRGTNSGPADVGVYLSADEFIRFEDAMPGMPEDRELNRELLGYLDPGQCKTVPISGYVNPPTPGYEGAYFVGAIVDPYETTPELIEDDNALAGYRMGVGSRADFVVTSVTGPDSAQIGQSITAQVTVCNQGTQGDSTDVGVYLSTDATIEPNVPPGPPVDFFLGSAFVSYLAAGQCTTVPVSGNAYLPSPGTEGPYFIGAVADPYASRPELMDDNNTLAGYRIGMGNKPDFVITSVTGPASAYSGYSVTAKVTVCNRGTQGDSTDVGVYLSADATIRANVPPGPPEDSLIGSAMTGYLYPGQCKTVPVSGNAYPPAPGTDGPYFIGAVADPYASRPELNEENNALAGYRMGVGSKPDLVITSVTGPASALYGQYITTQVTICNRGTDSALTDVGVFLSADEFIQLNDPPDPTQDYFLGWDSVSYLYPGQCKTVPISGYANPPLPGQEGPYFIGAIVDPYETVPELIDDNNVLAGYRMGVGSLADFVVTSVTGPASVQSGQSFTTQVTVCNKGTQGESTDVGVYLSADATIRANVPPGPPEDSFIGSATTGHLYPGQCTTVPVSGNASPPAPGTEGPYYVGAVADPYASRPELMDDNNTLAGYRMGVGASPDFVITSVTGPYSVKPGNAFTVSVGFCNRGQQSSSTTVDLFLSADTDVRVPAPPIPPEDTFLGTIPNTTLAVGACTTRSLSVTAPSVPEGAWYLGAVADPSNARVELNEENNSKAGNVIGVGNKADFVITAVTGPNSVKPGTAFTISTTVCNRGQFADTTDVELYLSADANVPMPTPPYPPEDTYLGVVTGISLAAGACTTRSLSVTAPSVAEGAWYLGAVADPYNSRVELIEDNNPKAGNVIGVGNKADFVITAVTGPASVVRNASFSASVTVCNRGQLTDTTNVDLYFSVDSTIRVPTPPIPPEDFYLGTISGVSLGVGACSTRSITVSASVPTSGSYYLGAVADPSNARVELNEENNTKAGTSMSVTP